MSRSSWSRSVAAGWRAGSPSAIKALRPCGARHRRRARARGRRARIAGSRRDRPLAGRAGVPDVGRRDEDAGARRADVRAPARLSRFDRHRLRGRDRGRGPAGGRAEPARGRTIGRAGHRGDGVPRARSRARSDATGRSWPWSAAGTWTRSGIATTSSRRSRRRAEPGRRPGARLTRSHARPAPSARRLRARPPVARRVVVRGSGSRPARHRPGDRPGPRRGPRPASSPRRPP